MGTKEPAPRRLLALLCALAAGLFLLALLYYPSLYPAADRVPTAALYSGAVDKLNLNTASAQQLQLLPGIGEVKAQAIVDYREEHGDFTSTEQLLEVKGIDETTYAGLKDYVFV